MGTELEQRLEQKVEKREKELSEEKTKNKREAFASEFARAYTSVNVELFVWSVLFIGLFLTIGFVFPNLSMELRGFISICVMLTTVVLRKFKVFYSGVNH